jgi:hypothetical protein
VANPYVYEADAAALDGDLERKALLDRERAEVPFYEDIAGRLAQTMMKSNAVTVSRVDFMISSYSSAEPVRRWG